MINIQSILEESAYKRKQKEPPRDYLGMSEIGHECERYLWIKFHYPELKEKISGSLCRVFEQGHHTESKLLKEILDAGIDVFDRQSEFSFFNGLFNGHCDGIISFNSEEYILEIKSASDKNFKDFEKKGIKNHPVYGPKYYAQGILYAGASDLQGTIFLIENKNAQQLYQEFIPFDADMYAILIEKAERIIYGKIPKGISSRPDWYKCVHCEFNHENACRKQWDEPPF